MVRFTDWYSRRKYGREMEMAGVIGTQPAEHAGVGDVGVVARAQQKVDERLKALAATKAATRIGCAFCIDIASSISREAGVTEEQLRDFHDYRNERRLLSRGEAGDGVRRGDVARRTSMSPTSCSRGCASISTTSRSSS